MFSTGQPLNFRNELLLTKLRGNTQEYDALFARYLQQQSGKTSAAKRQAGEVGCRKRKAPVARTAIRIRRVGAELSNRRQGEWAGKPVMSSRSARRDKRAMSSRSARQIGRASCRERVCQYV